MIYQFKYYKYKYGQPSEIVAHIDLHTIVAIEGPIQNPDAKKPSIGIKIIPFDYSIVEYLDATKLVLLGDANKSFHDNFQALKMGLVSFYEVKQFVDFKERVTELIKTWKEYRANIHLQNLAIQKIK